MPEEARHEEMIDWIDGALLVDFWGELKIPSNDLGSDLREAAHKGWDDLDAGRYDDVADEDVDDFILTTGSRSPGEVRGKLMVNSIRTASATAAAAVMRAAGRPTRGSR